MILMRVGEVLTVNTVFSDPATQGPLDVSGAESVDYAIDDGAWTALTMSDPSQGTCSFVFTATVEGSSLLSYRITWSDGSIEILPDGGDDTIRVIQ